MTNKSIVSITSLGLAGDGKYHINKNEDVIYKIDKDVEILVESNIKANIFDCSNNASISVVGDANSIINYTILDSKLSKRVFNISGVLGITQIVLVSSEEELNINLLSEGAEANVKCLCIASNMNNKFNQCIIHSAKNTASNISNVAVGMNKSSIVFDTTGKVSKGMSSSRCVQLSRGIVMDDVSIITAKPILLIDEFDCLANHGATIGKMSDEDLFYLMSRGLNKKEAFLLILKGIINPFISSIEIDDWKEKIDVEVSNLIEK